MKSILKDLKLESLFSKFAAKRIEPENVSELSDDDFVRLGVTTIEDRHRLRALYANTEKKNISLWLHLPFAKAWLFSADVVAAVEGVDLVRNEKFLRRELDSNFRLFSQPPSIENFVVDRKASAQTRHNGSVNSKRAHPPVHLLGISIQFNSIQSVIYTFIKYSHYIYQGRNTLIKEEKKKEKRKLMAWIEVYGGQGA